MERELEDITNIKLADDILIQNSDGTAHLEATAITFEYNDQSFKIPHTIGEDVDTVKSLMLKAINAL